MRRERMGERKVGGVTCLYLFYFIILPIVILCGRSVIILILPIVIFL